MHHFIIRWKIAMPGARMFPVAHVIAPSLQHARDVARALHGHQTVGIPMVDEHRCALQALRLGETAPPLVHEGLVRRKSGKLIGLHLIVIIPSAEEGGYGGEQVGMPRAQIPCSISPME